MFPPINLPLTHVTTRNKFVTPFRSKSVPICPNRRAAHSTLVCRPSVTKLGGNWPTRGPFSVPFCSRARISTPSRPNTYNNSEPSARGSGTAAAASAPLYNSLGEQAFPRARFPPFYHFRFFRVGIPEPVRLKLEAGEGSLWLLLPSGNSVPFAGKFPFCRPIFHPGSNPQSARGGTTTTTMGIASCFLSTLDDSTWPMCLPRRCRVYLCVGVSVFINFVSRTESSIPSSLPPGEMR